MSRVFSQIAFLDTVAISELLEVVEGGLLLGYRRNREKTDQRTSTLRGLFSGLGGEHTRGSTRKEGGEDEYKTSPVGNLGRVFNVLDENNLVSEVFGSDAEAWIGVTEGEFIECEVLTSIPRFHALLDFVNDLLARMPGAGAPMPGVDPAQMATLRDQLQMIKAWLSTDSSLPVFLQPADDEFGPRRFWANLDPNAGVFRRRALEGPGVVLGKVRRVLATGERADLVQLGGLQLPKGKMESLLQTLQGNELLAGMTLSDLRAEAPSIELQVLAILA